MLKKIAEMMKELRDLSGRECEWTFRLHDATGGLEIFVRLKSRRIRQGKAVLNLPQWDETHVFSRVDLFDSNFESDYLIDHFIVGLKKRLELLSQKEKAEIKKK